MSADDALKGYLRDCRRRNLSPGSIRHYQQALLRVQRDLGLPLIEATHEEMLEVLDSYGHGPRTRAAYVTALRSFFRWAEDDERLTGRNPMARVPTPRVGRLVPRPLTDDQLEEALTGAPARMRAWLALAAYSGLRVAEICGLRREDIMDWADPPMLVVTHAKGNKERVVPLNGYVLSCLRLAGLPASGFVFTAQGSHRAVQPATVTKFVARYLRERGIEGTAHRARHSFATGLYRRTHDLRMVQEMLGHAHPQSTAGYAAYATEDGAAAVALLGPTAEAWVATRQRPPPRAPVTPVEPARVPATAAVARQDLTELWPRFDRAQRQAGWAPSTSAKVHRLLVALEGMLLPRTVLDATGDDLGTFLAARPVARSSTYNYACFLRAFYGWAVQEGLLSEDPSAGLTARALTRSGQ